MPGWPCTKMKLDASGRSQDRVWEDCRLVACFFLQGDESCPSMFWQMRPAEGVGRHVVGSPDVAHREVNVIERGQKPRLSRACPHQWVHCPARLHNRNRWRVITPDCDIRVLELLLPSSLGEQECKCLKLWNVPVTLKDRWRETNPEHPAMPRAAPTR